MPRAVAADVQHGNRGRAEAVRHLRRRRLRQRPRASYLSGHRRRWDAGDRAAGQAMAVSSQQVMDRPSAGLHRAGQQGVRGAAGQGDRRQGRRRRGNQPGRRGGRPDEARQTFRTQQAELDQTTAERSAAQAKLDAAEPVAAPSSAPVAPAPAVSGQDRSRPDRLAAGAARTGTAKHGAAAPGGSQATGTHDPARHPSAFASGDPIAIINAILGIAETSAQLHRRHGAQVPAEARHPAHAHRLHQQRCDPAGAR